MKRLFILLVLGLLVPCNSAYAGWWLVGETASSAPAPATDKLAWTVSSDTVETPSGKTASRTGAGAYITTGCYSGGSGGCYDNGSGANRVDIPIASNDIIDPTDFDVTFYVNNQAADNYDVVFSYAVDSGNRHQIEIYADGLINCRTYLNGQNLGDAVKFTGAPQGTWVKIQYIYSDASAEYLVYIDDVLELTVDTTGYTLQGTPTTVRFCQGYNNTNEIDALIDEVTIN